ncbi:M23 family metallopeptidase [Nocardia sp. NPDC088792]|uniref:M23 family metallopeptidase n=1 Tax=Nocardia sp. NPDC088792 TaxID=3364332 RepID=UPI00381E58A4
MQGGPTTDEARRETGDDPPETRKSFHVGVSRYTPGVLSHLRTHDEPSRARRELAQAARVTTAFLREQAGVARERARQTWELRPRSWAEVKGLPARGRAEAKRQWPIVRAWSIRHRVLIGGLVLVLVFAGADSALALIPTDAPVEAGVALRVPVQYPLQIQASPETSKRYLDAINNGEHLREQAVVEDAARATLDRAKAEAAAAVAGQPQPWMNAPAAPDTALPPGFVIPGVGGFVLPARGVFSSGYGMRWGTFHWGIDIAAPIGSPIYAVAAGTVIDAGPAQGFGLWVRIRHDDGTISVYGHMYDFSVSVGERVPAGLQIARIGNRGDSTGPHLHFEILVNGQHVDPQPWLAQRGIVVG